MDTRDNVVVGNQLDTSRDVGGVEHQGTKYRRILSSQAGSEPFGKFSTLSDFSTGSNLIMLIGSNSKCSVLSMELLQFYYSPQEMIPFSNLDGSQAVLARGCTYAATRCSELFRIFKNSRMKNGRSIHVREVTRFPSTTTRSE